MRKGSFFVVLALFAPGSSFGASHFDSWLPREGQSFDTFALKPAKKYEVLQERMRAAIAKNRDWFNKYYESNGGKAPYHPNFGLSEKEYEMVNNVPADGIRFRKVGTGHASVTRNKEGQLITVKANGLGPFAEGVSFNPATSAVVFGDGVTLDLPSPVESDDSRNVFGAQVEGLTWQSVDAKSQSVADNRDLRQVQVIHFKGKSLCHLSARIERAEDGRLVKNLAADLRYACPKR